MSQKPSAPTWTRLICFTAQERVGTFLGEPIDDLTVDIGLELSHKARSLGLADDQVQARAEAKAKAEAGAESDTHVVDEPATAADVTHTLTPEADAKEIKARVWDMSSAWSEDGKFTGEVLTVKRLFSPINPRGAIRAVGLNYKDHAAEMGLPLPTVPSIFMKPQKAIANPNSTIIIPACAQNDEVDYEVELAVVLSKYTKNVTEKEAMGHVLGYMVGNDLTARKVQDQTSQWGYSKGFDDFLPVGPVLLSPRALPDPSVLRLKTYLNGEIMQDGFASSMIFSIPKIISFLSQGTTLPPGTVIITGTPSGIGNSKSPKVWLKDGDVVRCWISHGIGSLINRIKYETEEYRVLEKVNEKERAEREKKRKVRKELPLGCIAGPE